MIYLRLFFEFFKTGLFSVGGGLATLPFLYSMSQRTGWFTASELTDMIAVSESTPGPIGVNMATYVGYVTGGIPGALIATLGLILPGIIIVLIIAKALEKFWSNKLVDSVFYGIRACSVALIATAFFLVVKISILNIPAYTASRFLPDILNFKALLLAMLIIVLTRFIKVTKKLHPVLFIALSAVAGIVFSF